MAQLVLPLDHHEAMRRDDFIAASGNARALAFVEAFPDWAAPAAALYGPPASGKTHLARIWAERSGAAVIAARDLHDTPPGALAIENVDDGVGDEAALFALLERGGPLLLTARLPPTQWRAGLPDLTSRFAALIAFGLGAPDEALLIALAVKLFADRQLVVPENVVTHLVQQLERSPAALRDFIARADAAALQAQKPINLQLIRGLMADSSDRS
jgi:chromosomal replication initiation ATPase DnaA